MPVYRNLVLNLPISDPDKEAWKRSLGYWVMQEAARLSLQAPRDMTQITDAFYRALVHFNWRWTPAQPCGSQETAAKILDGDIQHVECRGVATAFRQLLTAPAPYGFALKPDKAVVRVYQGGESLIGADNGKPTVEHIKRQAATGFYSVHPRDGVHGLRANVFDPATNQMANLYAWSDHKVVEVEGRYWDVCYNASYLILQQMAVAIVIGENYNSAPTKTLQEAQARVTETKVVVKNWFQIAYFRTAVPGSPAEAAGAKEIGPYAESIYGDETTEGVLKPLINWAAPI